ncbi:MAG TPA: hypothetical protein VLE43_16385 [Candidatus Saccharimonadia bacterium]|nr:hypothetical protein [Candidatus Saccharimonadia bacterium]
MMLFRVILFLSLACGLSHATEATSKTPAEIAKQAEVPAAATTPAAPAVLTDADLQKLAADPRLPGIALSEGISQVTGTAISPLLGVSAVGAWKYIQTPAHQRHLLPWYCHPWAWGIGFGLITLVLMKDVFGAAAPALVKKPLDFAELFEDKASALMASTAFVPLIALAMAQVNAIPLQDATTSMTMPAEMGFATATPQLAFLDIPWVRVAIYMPVMIVCFLVVWLSSHAINVLIALSPFGLVDVALKFSKLALLVLVTGASLIHPLLGLLICLPIIALAAYLSGWAFRFTVFGTVFGWDLLLCRKADTENLKEGVRCFTARKANGVPVRTYGKLKVNALGMHVFHHRAWLILPAREVALEQPVDGLTRGMLHPTITRSDLQGRPRGVFLLSPRYRHCIEEIGGHLGIQSFSDSPLRRGLKAVKIWFADVAITSRTLIERSAVNSTVQPVPRLQQ